jgi:sensor domain DACNV-containing protein
MNSTFSLDPDVIRAVREEYLWGLQEIERDQAEGEVRYLASDVPSADQIRSLIEVAFWASLERVESRHHPFSIAFCPKESAREPFIFTKPLPFKYEHLAKLSPALDAGRTVIGVWEDSKKLSIWGFCAADRRQRLLIKVFDAGQIVFSFDASPHAASFSALISGSRLGFIEQSADPLLNALWRSNSGLLDSRSQLDYDQLYFDFRAIAMQMRLHGHGGTLLIVPAGANLQGSLNIEDSAYGIDSYDRPKRPGTEYLEERGPEFFGGSDSATRTPKWDIHDLKSFGRLTAIDGATVITYDLAVLAFGAKIRAKEPNIKPVEVLISEPFRGGKVLEPSGIATLGWGTRHLSAAQFVYDQQKLRPIAIVASQDGGVSIFEWMIDQERVSVTRHTEFAVL